MRRFMTLMCVPAIIVMLAACGSSSSSKSAKTSSTTAKTSSTSAGSATAVVKTANSTTLGKIVVDSSGKTLYALSNNGKTVACTSSACVAAWPPLLLPAGMTTASGGNGVAGLGTTAAAGGTQVTVDGKPLYRFAGDQSAGDTNGENITSFGGTWHAVKVGSSSSATTSTPTTSGSSSGY